MLFSGEAAGMVFPAAQGREMAAKAGAGCPSVPLFQSPGPFPLGQPRHLAQVNRSELFYSILRVQSHSVTPFAPPP